MKMAFTIQRNAGGVPGLILAMNVLSEEGERHIFECPQLFSPVPTEKPPGKVEKFGNAGYLSDFPVEVMLLPKLWTVALPIHMCRVLDLFLAALWGHQCGEGLRVLAYRGWSHDDGHTQLQPLTDLRTRCGPRLFSF